MCFAKVEYPPHLVNSLDSNRVMLLIMPKYTHNIGSGQSFKEGIVCQLSITVFSTISATTDIVIILSL